MIIQTDVKCLYCGHVSWRVEMEHGAPWRTAEMVWPELGAALPARPQCTRCGGPVYLDGDYREVRVRQSEARARRQQLRSDGPTPAAIAESDEDRKATGSSWQAA